MSATSTRSLPRPLHLVSNSSASGASSPLAAQGPLSAPLSSMGRNEPNPFDVTKTRSNPRRQSSISYNPKSRAGGLGRSNSVGSKVALSSLKDGDENRSPKMRETEPITLAEKHADLLRFIAQKESKCLELRTQLAQHEADLLLLKRKWERIVSKGSPSSTTSTPTVGGDMLDGIREGVQTGLGKVFAVLEPSSSHVRYPSSTPAPKHRAQHPARDISTSASSSKRTSIISTASSSSARARSSLSGSGSSASSLFDEVATLDSASSVASGSTACPSPDSGRPSKAFKRNSLSLQSPSLNESPPEKCEANSAGRDDDVDPSAKKRRSRPSSVNLSQLPAPLLSPGGSIQHMSNWVPGLNKKWAELKGNETISKQSKRASVLLSDVLAVLAPPIPSTPTPPSSTAVNPLALDSAFFDSSMRESPSLLDDDDGFTIGDVMTPEVKPSAAVTKLQDKTVPLGRKEDEEEWNW